MIPDAKALSLLFRSQSSALDDGPFGTNKRHAAIEPRDYLAATTCRIMPSVFV